MRAKGLSTRSSSTGRGGASGSRRFRGRGASLFLVLALACTGATTLAAPASFADQESDPTVAATQTTAPAADETTAPATTAPDSDTTIPATTEPTDDASTTPVPDTQDSLGISPRATAKPISCEAGTIYSVSSGGQLREIKNGTVTDVGTKASSVSSFNGLGIGTNGQPIYAYNRTNSQTAAMYKYDAGAGTWTNTGDSYKTSDTNKGNFDGTLVAGAVNLSNGKYLFGGFETTSSGILWWTTYTQVFKLWQYDASANPKFSYLGYIETYSGQSDPGATNGDMAFDANGNLFVVRGSGSTTTVYSVTAANLAKANGGQITSSGSNSFGTTSNVNGVAFDSSGKAYLGADSTVQSFNMPDWSGNTTVTSGLNSSTDLASCSSPATVTLEKVVDGRWADTDQFELTLSEGSTKLGTATTEGTASGVQEQRVGPQPAVRGKTLTFEEKGTGTTDLENYTSSYKCTVDGKSLVAESVGRKGTVTIPASGNAVLCQITNKAIPKTSLTLVKELTNSHGGTAGKNDFNLTATPSSGTALSFNSGDTKEVLPGSYALSEVLLSGYEQTGLTCKANGKDLPVKNGSIDVSRNQAITCTFANRDKPGTVIWNKADENGKALGGSEWKITGPEGNGSAELPIEDCVADNASTCTGSDKNPAAGAFKVDDLSWGKYKVVETKAPAGYQISSDAHEFVISGDTLEVTVSGSPFKNLPRKGPVLPLTGGLGRDFFAIAGGGTLLSGGAAAAYALKRRKSNA